MLNLFKAITRKTTPEAQESGPSTAASETTRAPASGTGGTASRKQLLAVVLRETLLRNAVPNACLGMEFFRTMDRAGARTDGIHVRLVVRDLHAEIAARMVELERDFRRRLAVIDWRAAQWLQGVSWQLDLPEHAQERDAQATAAATQEGVPAAALRSPAASDGEAPLPRGRRASEQDAQGRTFASTEPAPL